MAEELSKKVLMGFIILCIIAVIMFLFINRSRQEFWNLSQKELCKKSVEIQMMQKGTLTVKGSHLTDIFGNPVELKCPTEYKTVSDKDDNIVKRRIANAMYHCWDQFGKGEKEIFDTKDNNYCVICSRLEFTEKKEIDGFTKFLIEEKPTPVSDSNYFEYFTGVKAEDNQVLERYEIDMKNIDKLDLTEPKAVIFAMDKNAYPGALLPGAEQGKIVTAIGGNVAGALAGTVAGLFLCSSGLGCVAGVGILTSAAGTWGGYAIGSDTAAEWDARILLADYNSLERLDCSYLEGQATPLKPVEMGKYK